MSSQYAEPQPTNGWDWFVSLGHPANLNGFRVLASLLHRCHSPEANLTLHDVWPSPGLVHYIYIFGPSCPLMEFIARCKIHFATKSYVLLYCQHYCTVLEQLAWAKLCGVELRNCYRGRYLYSVGQPSRWESAHILVHFIAHIFLHLLHCWMDVKWSE